MHNPPINDGFGTAMRSGVVVLGLFSGTASAHAIASASQYGFAKYVQPCSPTADSIGVLIEELNALVPGTGEDSASEAALSKAKHLLEEACKLTGYTTPMGEVDGYFGEVGIEWRNDTRLLRLTCFSTAEAARIDFGIMSKNTPGEYASHSPVTPEILAAKLDWISKGSVLFADSDITG